MTQPYQVTEHFSVERVHGVIARFTFTRMAKPEADAYDRYIRKAVPTLTPPVRALYDMRHSVTPIPYFSQKMEALFREIVLPEDTRTAYIIEEKSNFRPWIQILRKGSTSTNTGLFQVFTEEDKAIAWLLEGVEGE
jgi:hypothetical protein